MLTYRDLDRINWQRTQDGKPRLSMQQAERALQVTTNGTRAAMEGGQSIVAYLVGLQLLSGIAGPLAVPLDPLPIDTAAPGNEGDAGGIGDATGIGSDSDGDCN